MKWLFSSAHKSYHRLKEINERFFGHVSVILFSCIYILILPWFYVFVKKTPPVKRTNWSPWTIQSATLEDLKKQY